MPNYQVITKTTYANKRWLRYSSYAHAADAALMPLAHTELPTTLLVDKRYSASMKTQAW
jgi:hypothetical protein